MKIHLLHRAVSFTLSAIITLGLFGGIDHLAADATASGVWAAAASAPRAGA